MKKLFLSMWVAVLFISCNPDQSKEKTTEAPVIALADFNTKAGEWVGKEVIVEGIVDHVCKHGGKRLFLVDDKGDVHVDSEKRFDDALKGSQIVVKGIVTEFRVDEAYCLQQEQDFIQKHKEGVDPDSVYNQKMEGIQYYRDSMKTAGKDHLSYYSIEYISHEEKK
jgi:DNA/RNA endonuclease YhcR with UshA esterase domain